MSDESLADRLNRLARQKQEEQETKKRVHRTQEQVEQFILANAKRAFDELLNILEKKVADVNASIEGLPAFEWQRNGPYAKQGNVAAFLSFHQAFTNAGPITFRIAFGREPGGFYIEGFSEPPE